MRKHSLVVTGIVAAALAGGCNFSPKYEKPAAPVPAQFPSGGPAYGEGAVSADAAPVNLLPWQDFYTDAKLARIIAVSIENNRDLRLAALNTQRARELYGVQRSELYPAVDAGAGMTRQRVSEDLVPGDNGNTTSESWNVNMGVASWEIDFFGRIRNLSQAALQQYFATEQAQRSAQMLLVSGVAEAYLSLAADAENLKLAQTTLQSQQESYRLVLRRFELGLTPELDVHRAATQVAVAESGVLRYTQAVARDKNALDLLAGQPLSEDLLSADLESLTPPPVVMAGLSSEVLLERPDVIQAEHQLRAAYANIGAARAAFFPRISLTGSIGTASDELSGLFSSGTHTWSYGPRIVMPIFDARVWAAKRVTEVDREIAVTQYERVIQQSFRDVADALAVRGTVGQLVAAKESQVRAISETYRLAGIRYERGIDSYLGVLDAQRELYFTQQELVFLRLAELVNRVNLYEALGGGWRNPAPQTAAAPTTQPTG